LAPVRNSVAGYLTPSLTLCNGEYARSALNCSASLTVPYSGMLNAPLGDSSTRYMS
jgi:hypothetical protein